jgi:hypothetical protein
LFIAHPPTALFASIIIVVYGLFQTIRRACHGAGSSCALLTPSPPL